MNIQTPGDFRYLRVLFFCIYRLLIYEILRSFSFVWINEICVLNSSILHLICKFDSDNVVI